MNGMVSVSPSKNVRSLSGVIDRDIMAADFLVSIFWSAMTSFRHDSILRPFPPGFNDEVGDRNIAPHAHKDIEKLVSVRTILASYLGPLSTISNHLLG